jgi:hypothetical protein
VRVVAEGLEKLASGAETYSSVGRWAWEATGRSRTRPAKLSDAEREGRAKVAEWRRAVRAAEAAGKRPPAKPKGLSLDPLPSASATRRRRRDADGRELPARRTPSARSAEARNRWHVAADWVEMYAPVLWQPLHEQLLAAEAAGRWPAPATCPPLSPCWTPAWPHAVAAATGPGPTSPPTAMPSPHVRPPPSAADRSAHAGADTAHRRLVRRAGASRGCSDDRRPPGSACGVS